MARKIAPVERRIEVSDGLVLAAKEWPCEGTCAGRVLALHGFMDNANTWDALIPHLAPNLHVLALDFPGNGHSGLWTGPYHFPDLIECIAMVAQCMKWLTFAILGHSLGGNTGVFAAASLPKQVTALIMVEAWGPVTIRIEDTVKSSVIAVQDRLKIYSSTILPTAASLDEAAQRFVAAMGTRSPISFALARRIAERNWKLNTATGQFEQMIDRRTTCRLFLNPSEDQVLQFIAGIQCPTLMIGGSKGFEISHYSAAPKRAEFAARRVAFRYLEERTIPEAYHYPHFDQAAEVAPIINKFLVPSAKL